MNEFLWQTFHRLISETDTTHTRFLYHQLNLNSRLIGIVGPRGVGKTTLLLQYLKNNFYKDESAFYFSADNIYFNDVSILEAVDELYQKQNIKIFFIDEIHRYPNWNQELKNIYDSFPQVKVYFSGSSSLDLVHGVYDLSRRATVFHLPGLSFREYVNIKTNNNFEPINFKELIHDHQKWAAQLSTVMTINKYFQEYLLYGYYPIVFQEQEKLYDLLATVIDKTIYEDIANFYNLKTGNLTHFKRIINFLSSIPPGKVTTNNVAKHLGIDNKTADYYLEILNKTGMLKFLYPIAHGNQVLTKFSKVYLDNTTLFAAMNTFLSADMNVGTQRELAFLQAVRGAGLKIFYSEEGDFKIDDILFEVGGKNKTGQQLKHYKGKKILVKDNILLGSKNEIPLYLFGFLY